MIESLRRWKKGLCLCKEGPTRCACDAGQLQKDDFYQSLCLFESIYTCSKTSLRSVYQAFFPTHLVEN